MIRDVPPGFMRATGGMTLEEARAWWDSKGSRVAKAWVRKGRGRKIGDICKCNTCGREYEILRRHVVSRFYRCIPCQNAYERARYAAGWRRRSERKSA